MTNSETSHAVSDSCDTVLRDVAMLSVDEARERILSRAAPVAKKETVPLSLAHGRILAGDIIAHRDVPAHALAAMDGYAVALADLDRRTATRLPLGSLIAAGGPPSCHERGRAMPIGTGAVMPLGADAVIMKEKARCDGAFVTVGADVSAGQNVRFPGSEIANGKTVLAKGTRLSPMNVGIAAALGLTELAVARPLRVAVITTGTELSAPGTPLAPGKRYNSNATVLHGLLARTGCETVLTAHVADDLDGVRHALLDGAGCADVIITSGGVSVGAQDYVKEAINLEGTLELWRVAIKPGKPLAFGNVRGVPIFALPGNPAALVVTFCLFARPFLRAAQSAVVGSERWMWGQADFCLQTKAREEFVVVRMNSDSAGENRLTRIGVHDSASLMAFAAGDGLARAPAFCSLQRGQMVRFLAFEGMWWW